MKQADVISFPRLAARLPGLIGGLPGIVKGLKIANVHKSKGPVGLGTCVETAVARNPDGVALIYEDLRLTYSAFNAWANRIAHYLIAAGLKKGDVAAVMLENRPELLAVVTACAKIGVVSALVNTSQRGKVLSHSINLVDPKIAIVGEELIEAYTDVGKDLVVPEEGRFFLADRNTLMDPGQAPSGWSNLAELLDGQLSNNLAETQDIEADDPCFYIYTSGTTGMPKAVIFNHGRYMKAYGSFGFSTVKLTPEDRMYVCMPFYHATAMAVCWGSVLAGAAGLVMARRFSASRFWDEIRRNQVTAFGYVGELCRYLMDRPARHTDADNQVRVMVGNGLRPSIWKAFKARFGIARVMEFYASSEGNIGFTNLFNFDNTVGISPFPFAIVKYDQEEEQPVRNAKGFMVRVRRGEAGLLIGKITEKTPFDGYTDPEKTQKSILKNVFEEGDEWFDTGDLMRNMGFRHAQFVDRLGDTFRWKGENVSTTEVEQIIDDYDQISEAVVYGVEIPHTNGRAGMASIRLDCEESAFDFGSLLSHLKKDMPPYAIPIFLKISSGIETTGTFKHKKAPLKAQGFDLSRHEDPIYVWLPKSDTYSLLTEELQKQIEAGEIRY